MKKYHSRPPPRESPGYTISNPLVVGGMKHPLSYNHIYIAAPKVCIVLAVFLPRFKHDCKQVPQTSDLRAARRFWGWVQTCPLPTCSYLRIRNRIRKRKRHLEKAFDPSTAHALNISETLPYIYTQSARGPPHVTACMPAGQLI